jgi:ABC-2 type transport system ATP-binding protein
MAQAPRTQSIALAVEHLTKRFGDRVAFEDLTFSVGAGQVFGFLGPNGAGKTTTVRTLGTLISPTSGRAEVAGIALGKERAQEIRQHISIMTEAAGLYLRLTVFENLEFFAGLYGVKDADARIAASLEAVNLSSRARDVAGTLSKGLRQRATLARCLLSEPSVLFLDEPTSGLDPEATVEVHDLINGLRERGVTIFLTTHRLEEAEGLCDVVAIVNTRLLTTGTPDELRRRLFSAEVEVRTRAPLDAPDTLFRSIAGVRDWRVNGDGAYLLSVSDATTVKPEMARALVAAGADILGLTEARRSLEDVYLKLIHQDAEAAP